MISLYLSVIDSDEDRSKFEKAYIANRDMMYNTAYRILHNAASSEDAVHDAFLSTANVFDKISHLSDKAIRNYLFIVVRNAALRLSNKQSRELPDENELSEQVPDISNIEADVEDRELQEKVFSLVKALDDKYSDILMMKFFYEMKDREIAEVTGLTVEAVKARIHRGREMLKKQIKETGLI